MTATARNLSPERQTQALEHCRQWLEMAPLFDICSQHFRGLLRESAGSQGLNERQAMILWHAASHPLGSAQIELAKELAVSPGQLSLLLEQLRQRGLLDCVRDLHDRRRQRNVLTASGHAAWNAIEEKLSQRLAYPKEALTVEALGRLRTMLDELCQPATDAPELKLHRATATSESTSPEGP